MWLHGRLLMAARVALSDRMKLGCYTPYGKAQACVSAAYGTVASAVCLCMCMCMCMDHPWASEMAPSTQQLPHSLPGSHLASPQGPSEEGSRWPGVLQPAGLCPGCAAACACCRHPAWASRVHGEHLGHVLPVGTVPGWVLAWDTEGAWQVVSLLASSAGSAVGMICGSCSNS